jgi:hypothetical protein
MEKRRDAYRVLVEKPREEEHLEDRGVDGRIILKWIFETQDRERWRAVVNAECLFYLWSI